jgi:hypothetical protein
MRGWSRGYALFLVVFLFATGAPALAELRINDLDVYLNDHDVTVHLVALGTVPPSFYESLQSGLPAHVRFTVELWRYNRLWRDRLLTTYVVERQLSYNVVSKEYRVSFLKGESRGMHTTRDIRDAQRVLSEIRAVKLTTAVALDPADVIYIRAYAETSVNGENTFLSRMAGTAEQAMRQSEFRTIVGVQ